MKIQVIDLFCGGGGATEGFIQGGGDVVLAIDSWDSAIKLHELNHPTIPILNEVLGTKVFQYYIDLFLEFLDNPDHVHLHGSPPCQAISNASSIKKENGYFMVDWFIDLAKKMEKICLIMGWSFSWSMENVLPIGKHLSKNKIPYVTINSADEGVPQKRKRVIAGEGWLYEKRYLENEWQTVIDALPHLKELQNNNPDQKVLINNVGYKKPKDNWDFSINETSQTLLGKIPVIKLKSMGSRLFIDTNNIHERVRSLTLEEASVLMGYPEFKTNHKDVLVADKWKILGNMVCPQVAESIIIGIKRKNKLKTLFSNWH